jgi:RNA polymerase sigma factor (sigma-70 family)
LDPDDQLRRAFAAGDVSATRKVRDWIEQVARSRAFGLEDPEEAIGNALHALAALASAGGLDNVERFHAFVRRIARNKAIDRFRIEAGIRAYEGPMPDGPERPGPEGAVPPTHSGADEIIRYVMQKLSEECRKLWRWVYFERLPESEVAQRLGIRLGTARVRVHRCLKRGRKLAEAMPLSLAHSAGFAQNPKFARDGAGR